MLKRTITLNTKERMCLLHSAQGKSLNEISDDLSLSEVTVSYYFKSLTGKLGARNICHAVALAIRDNHIQPAEIV